MVLVIDNLIYFTKSISINQFFVTIELKFDADGRKIISDWLLQISYCFQMMEYSKHPALNRIIHIVLKGEGNFQKNLSWFNSRPPVLLKCIGEKAPNALKVKLLALKKSHYGSSWWLPSSSMALSSHVQKQLPLLYTNVNHTQCELNHAWPQ